MMPRACVNGHELYFEDRGAGDALILLHGDYECTRYWAAQLDAFSAGYRVVAYDRQGFGRSAGLTALPPDFYDQDAADLIALLDHLEIAHAHLVGHSGGGTVALLAAARYPARVRSIVAAGAHSYVEPLTVRYIQEFAERLDSPRLRRAGEACHGERWREVAQMFVDRWLDPAWRGWSILGELSAIRCPVLLMLATDDGTASQEQLAAMAGAIADVRTWVVPDGGHIIHRRLPAHFNQHVRRFLSSIAPHA
jgi:pimeloyl-ACP methyl ester carboxylesterase